MTISDILQHPVLPFEIEDVKLVKLFSFFLHSAPTIESATAISMEAARLDQNWMSFITSYPKESWLVIAPNCTFGAYMIKAGLDGNAVVSRRKKASVYKGYKRDEIEMRGDRAEMSDFPLYLNTVAGGLDCRNQAIGGFSFVVKIYALPVVEIIGQFLYLLGRYGFDAQIGYCF